MRALDRYRIVRPVGRGAAGGVFLAEDRIRGGALVALKRIHARADELLRASFEREFIALAALSLPGVAPVFDFGLARKTGDDDGGPFFTRAFIDGVPLDEAALNATTEERIRILLGVCDVVAPLHRAGVIHGDLKPGNLILDKRGRAHVIDFGLARVVTRRGEGAGGTPGYMAPELFTGESASISTDVYALGATLFAVLTGAAPFSEEADRGLAARLRGGVPKTPQGLDPLARRALDVALKALAYDRGERYPSVSELSLALSAVLGAQEPASLPFVAPRPRGHGDVIARLDARVMARASQPTAQGAFVLRGQRGSGKTTLLRELKWRAQLRGANVLETSALGEPLEPLASLLRQAMLIGDEGEPAEGAEGADTTLGPALTRGLVAVAKLGPTLVLVDDLDACDAVVGRALRMALHAEGVERVALVVAASDEDAPALKELGTRESVDVAPLGRDIVEQLVRESLFAVDASVVEALVTRTGCVPGRLVDALGALHTMLAPTASDVAALRETPAGTAAGRALLAAVSPEERKLLVALSVADGLPLDVADALANAPSGTTSSLVSRAYVRVDGTGASIADRALPAVLLAELGPSVAAEARRLLAAESAARLPVATRATLAVRSESADTIRSLVPIAMRELVAQGANEAALELSDALSPHVDGEARRALRLERVQMLHALGRYEAAWTEAELVTNDTSATSAERARAAVDAGRARASVSNFDEAVLALSRVPSDAEPLMRATALRELAKIHLRRGDYDAVERAVNEGLACAQEGDPVRVELLTSIGMVASYRGDHEGARARYLEALELAHTSGSRRDEATVRTFLAIDHHRAGDYARARDLYAESLEIARELGDVGSMATFALNLGAVTFHLGRQAKAAEHYEAAARLARRAGKVSTDVIARTNLASLHVYLGLYERARQGAERAKLDAEEAGLKPSAAQAIGTLGDLAARTGDVDAALAHYDDAIARFRQLGQRREVAEWTLDAAEALLDRDGPVDGSAAAARLAVARTLIDEEHIEEFRYRLRLLLARARGQTGDLAGAVQDLDPLLVLVHGKDRELEWQVLGVLGAFQAALGADFLARKHDQQAMEALEAIATALPRELREAFWFDPRRRDIRRRAGGREVSQSRSSIDTLHGPRTDARASRLLEIIKRLASEHDLDRLLERITESAVELSQAERGYVLLVGEAGTLEARTVSDGARHVDPSLAFSRSIAEAVLIDGEPIVTIDARDDRRLSEYMSVHKLMLKSVACLPIRGRVGTVGVLYLEHRVRTGRFAEQDMDLLFAFADQAAIAVENARLLTELEKRRAELEKANRELAVAKGEIERVLVTRTTELEESKRELGRAREELRSSYERHGIVGASEAMRRVFAIVDRVQESNVPVVIQGESGTGKELVARAIHYGGPRAKKPFVAINCAAMPEALLESELFGHVRGAFTGADRERRGMIAQATGGTLFLDEVGDMPAKMQVDLLRVLQDGKVRPVGGDKEETVDVRIIAASNKALRVLVKRGHFREDLYYRLNVVELALPPLRDRAEDVALLADHFLARFAKRDNVKPKRLSRAAMQRLKDSQLPGNVRQLEHLLLNAWVLVEGDLIDDKDLALGPGYGESLTVRGPSFEETPAAPSAPTSSAPSANDPPRSFGDFKATEKQRILEALEKHAWNRAKAAKALAMPRRTFYRRLREHGIL